MGFLYLGNQFAVPSILVPAVMFGWIPLVFLLFVQFPTRKAIIASFIVGWLFLPEAVLPLPGLPDYSKISATSYLILVAALFWDIERLKSFQLSWIDIPMIAWCLGSIMTSLTNGLGLYDGVTAAVENCVTWGLPYFLGRIYLNSLGALRHLAIGIFFGGLVYVPLCLYELRMSPQLHSIVYGSHAHSDFAQTMRYGGFRPTVFMRHGLAVGAWMMAASLIGIWLWRTGVIKRIFMVDIRWPVLALILTFALTKSTGAYGLFAIGIGLLFLSTGFSTVLPVVAVAVGVFVYIYINAGTESYFTDQLVQALSNVFSPERIQSLEYRFDNEELLVDHARSHIMWGWGGWDRSTVNHPETGKRVVQDSLWIIAYGMRGAIGLISLFSALLLPPVAFCLRYPASLWRRKDIAPVAVLVVVMLLYVVDCLLNAMINPIYILSCGGIAGVVTQTPALAPTSRSPQRRRIRSAALRR